jgi:3-oxoacyl-[acyl-carrier-protein] synthase-3
LSGISSRAGIISIGAYLPDDVRTNDWWPDDLVERWRLGLDANARELEAYLAGRELSAGTKRVIEAMRALEADPFRGARQRHVMAAGQLASEMELIAAQRALEGLGDLAPQIDFLCVFSAVPDYLNATNACLLHQQLGLRSECMTTALEAAGNSFLQQLELARTLIEMRRVRYALLIQSSSWSRVVAQDSVFAPYLGDAATAVLVGPVADGHGVVASAHFTDGSRHKALVTGVPGKRWYEGPVIAYTEDPRSTRDMYLAVPDRARAVVERALASAQISASNIDFYASHQGALWLGPVTQEFCGMAGANSAHSFASTGHINACAIPYALLTGVRTGKLDPGELVLMFSGGSGESLCAIVMRWSGKQ